MGIVRKLLETSPADAWRAVRRRVAPSPAPTRPPPRAPVERAFLESPEYARLMSEHLPHPGYEDRHEAQNETRSYRYRHHEVSDRLGAFRWRGLQKHLTRVLDLVDAPEGRVIDFGGAACPVGLRTEIVDRLDTDATGRPVPYRDISEVPDGIDGVFSSHALEHVEALDEVLAAIHAKLRPGGTLMVHAPSFTCHRWRSGVHQNALYADHHWTFGLREDAKPAGLERYRDLDTLLADYVDLHTVDHCGDDSLFLVGTRRSE